GPKMSDGESIIRLRPRVWPIWQLAHRFTRQRAFPITLRCLSITISIYETSCLGQLAAGTAYLCSSESAGDAGTGVFCRAAAAADTGNVIILVAGGGY